MSIALPRQDTSIVKKIILGSVQFGIHYGINNAAGIPDDRELNRILDYAYASGIQSIDCAEAYGNALDRIAKYQIASGNKFKIISKLKSIDDEWSASDKINEILVKLGSTAFEAMLLHDVLKYLSNPELINILAAVKAKGLIKKIGVSIYTNEQFVRAIADKEIDIIQLPFNLLDNESLRGPLLLEAKAAGKTIHVRSVFLQGLFFKNLDDLPAALRSLTPALQEIAEIAAEFKMSVQALALAYSLQNPLIDGVIIGVDSLAQLQDNIIAGSTHLSQSCISSINSIKIPDTTLLNPSTW